MVRSDSIEASLNTQDVQDIGHDFDPFISLPSQTSTIPMSPSMVRIDNIVQWNLSIADYSVSRNQHFGKICKSISLF